MVNSRQLLNAINSKTGRTLIRWHRRGLIPPPEVGDHPNGRGKIGFWPDWVLPRCLKIRKLLRDGQTLDEIAKLLGSDWEAEGRRLKSRPRHRIAEVLKSLAYDQAVETFAELVASKVYRSLKDFGIQRPGMLGRVEDGLSDDDNLVKRALALVRSGQNPMLVLGKDLLSIVPDFMVGLHFARSNGEAAPLCVVPILGEILKAFSSSMFNLPSGPSVKPVGRVRKEGVEGGEFEIVSASLTAYELKPVAPTGGRKNE